MFGYIEKQAIMTRLFQLLFLSLTIHTVAQDLPKKNSFATPKESKLVLAGMTISYSAHDGRLDGSYQSKYKNGNLKASGQFENGIKIGVWTYYNAEGVKVYSEVYSNHLAPTTLFQSSSKDSIEKTSAYVPKRNDKGYIDYFFVKESSYIWSRRQWCKMVPDNNNLIFGKDRLFKVLNDLILEESIVIYDSTDDQFTQKLALEDYKKRVNSSTKVAYYEIKEDYFFDNDRKTAEHRIITLTPFVMSDGINDGKPYKLCHLYYPELREYLAQHPIKTHNLRIKNLDDVFYFRDFDYSVAGTSSFKGRTSNSINVDNRFEERIKAIEQAHSVLIELK